MNNKIISIDTLKYYNDKISNYVDEKVSNAVDNLELDEEELDTDCATVGGWTVEMIGAMPVPFDSFDYQNYTILVMQVDDDSHRISRLLILKHEFSEDKK